MLRRSYSIMPELENLDNATDIITAWSGSNCQVVSHTILGSRWANRAISLLLLFRLQDNKLFKTNAG